MPSCGQEATGGAANRRHAGHLASYGGRKRQRGPNLDYAASCVSLRIICRLAELSEVDSRDPEDSGRREGFSAQLGGGALSMADLESESDFVRDMGDVALSAWTCLLLGRRSRWEV